MGWKTRLHHQWLCVTRIWYRLSVKGHSFLVFIGPTLLNLQFRGLIPAPVDQVSASAWLYTHPWTTCQRNKPGISMTCVACESKLRLVLRSSLMPKELDGSRAFGRVLRLGCRRI